MFALRGNSWTEYFYRGKTQIKSLYDCEIYFIVIGWEQVNLSLNFCTAVQINALAMAVSSVI